MFSVVAEVTERDGQKHKDRKTTKLNRQDQTGVTIQETET